MQLHHDSIAAISVCGTEDERQFVTFDDLARWRRQLLRILDQLDGRPPHDSGPGARVSRLRAANRRSKGPHKRSDRTTPAKK